MAVAGPNHGGESMARQRTVARPAGDNEAKAMFVCVLLAVALVGPAGAAAGPAQDGAAIAKALETRAVVLAGARINGDVQLGATVRHTLVCHECVIDGDVVAPAGATLKRGLDLTGSTISGRLDLAGATIQRRFVAPGAVFDGIVNLRGTTVGGKTNLSEAEFHSFFLADGGSAADTPTTFQDDADFTLARFSNLATFGNAVFTHGADFDLAKFESNVVFANACFGKIFAGTCVRKKHVPENASFAETIFAGPVDFSTATFWTSAGFAEAEFLSAADFTSCNFNGDVAFDRASFAHGATFLDSHFAAHDNQDSFHGASSGGNLNFNYATLWATDFSNIDVVGTVSFEDSTVPKDASYPAPKLSFSQAATSRFVMKTDDALDSVAGDDRTLVLRMIESSAAERNDLGTANDAHYARLKLESQNEWWGLRVLNTVFYQTIAGYLVRPLHPVLALVALAVAVTLVRVVHSGAGDGSTSPPRPAGDETPERAHHRALALEHRFRTSFFTTMALIGPKRGDDKEREGRQFEILTFRVLVACALIGFANSNPTLRQMLDAI
jgi:hypothetical protein